MNRGVIGTTHVADEIVGTAAARGVARRVARAAASLLLALLLGLKPGLPARAQAQNLCTTQASVVNPLAVEAPGVWKTLLGWLGVRPSEDKGGVGGTCVVAGRPGIGGTGISEGGIGGTGIVGVVTGFASICVNGVEVQFDADTPTSDNGQPGSARQLAVGQVVAVQAAGAAEALSARHIALIHAAVGPIETLNAATGEFRILGQSARALDPDASMTVDGTRIRFEALPMPANGSPRW